MHDTPKVNIQYDLLHDNAEYTITRNIYLMLRNVCCPEMDNMNCRNVTDIIFQKHGALPHFSLWVCCALKARFPN
jgi:hypothetical protein